MREHNFVELFLCTCSHCCDVKLKLSENSLLNKIIFQSANSLLEYVLRYKIRFDFTFFAVVSLPVSSEL